MTRIAIVGAGLMGEVHALSCVNIAGVTVSWVADLDLARAEALATSIGARATNSIEEAAAADDVDAVVVALPTPFHRTATELAARHGKHVFCEKPIARTMDDGEAMASACTRAGVRLMIGHVVRFFPEYVRIHDLLEAGTIGQVGVARASRINSHPSGLRPWYADLETSGGLVVDMMIHDFDTLRWYFGDVERVFAHGLSYSPHAATMDYTLALLRFASGVIAHVEASWAHASFRTSIEIAGEHGVIRHDSEQTASMRLERTGPAEPSVPTVPRNPLDEDSYRAEMRHFVDRVADGQPFLVEADEAIRALEVSLAVLESIRTGRPVHLGSARVAHEVAS